MILIEEIGRPGYLLLANSSGLVRQQQKQEYLSNPPDSIWIGLGALLKEQAYSAR